MSDMKRLVALMLVIVPSVVLVSVIALLGSR